MGQLEDDLDHNRSFWWNRWRWTLVWLVISAMMIIGAPSKEKK